MSSDAPVLEEEPGGHGVLTPELPTLPAGLDDADLDDPLAGSLDDTDAPTGAGPARPSRWRRLRAWYLFGPVVAYLSARVVTLLFLLGFDRFVPQDGFRGELFRWDGRWFVWAATQGYPATLPTVNGHVGGSTVAFFPVYPLVIRGLTDLTGLSPLVVGAVVSAVGGLTAVVAVGALVREFAGPGAATRGTLLFALFPGTFVFSFMYSEGILITCVALGLLALLRGRWWEAGFLGAVATGTSPVALAFVVSCAWCAGRAVHRRREWRALVAPALAPLGFVAYMAYLWAHTRLLSAWRATEAGGWKSYPSLAYPFRVVGTFLAGPWKPTETGQLLMAGTVVTVIGAVLAIRQRQPAPVLLYGLAAATLAALSAPVGLRPRFIMIAFPLVVAIGTRLRGKPYVVVVVASAIGLAAMTALEVWSWAVFP